MVSINNIIIFFNVNINKCFVGMKSAGTKENWNIVWDRFKKEVDPAEKEKLMSGLSYIQDAEVLNK